MKSHASLLLAVPVLLAAQMPAPDQSASPRATAGNGEAAPYDAVEFARVGEGEAMTAAHAQLPIGSIAEVTALDSGRIALVQIAGRPQDTGGRSIELSRAAAQALGVTGKMDAVRVRSIRASASDVAALRAGGSASPRLPAPDALLRALRRTMPIVPVEDAVPSVRDAAPPLSSAQRATQRQSPAKAVTKQVKATPPGPSIAPQPSGIRRGLLVQVAALRDEQRARAVARELNGRVEGAAGLWRVRLGPFADRVAAQRARDAAISRGYGGASIISAP